MKKKQKDDFADQFAEAMELLMITLEEANELKNNATMSIGELEHQCKDGKIVKCQVQVCVEFNKLNYIPLGNVAIGEFVMMPDGGVVN